MLTVKKRLTSSVSISGKDSPANRWNSEVWPYVRIFIERLHRFGSGGKRNISQFSQQANTDFPVLQTPAPIWNPSLGYKLQIAGYDKNPLNRTSVREMHKQMLEEIWNKLFWIQRYTEVSFNIASNVVPK